MTCPSDQDLAHVSECAACRARTERYKSVAGALPAAYATASDPAFARSVLDAIEQETSPRRTGYRLAFAGAMLAAAIASFLTLNVTDQRAGDFTARGGRGGTMLGFEVRRAGVRLEGGERIKTGDGFTFTIFNRAGRDVDVALFAIDGARETHWFYPAWTYRDAPPRSARIVANQETYAVPDGVIPESLARGKLTVTAIFNQGAMTATEIERAIARGELEQTFPDAVIETLELEVVP